MSFPSPHHAILASKAESGRSTAPTDWDYRWEFSGGGTIHFEIRPDSIRCEHGALRLDYYHDRYGSGTWRLNEATLRPIETKPRARLSPEEWYTPQAPGLQVRIQPGRGDGRSFLRWETLGPNRDRPRTGPLPEPSMLRLYYQ